MLKPALGDVRSLANYICVAYEETQSNRVSDFRDFVCSLFPKANLFDFYSIQWIIESKHKVEMRTRKLLQSDRHQALNTKGKDRQLQ